MQIRKISNLSRSLFASCSVWMILAGLVLAMVAATSCSRLEPLPPLARRVAVLDFKTPDSITDAPRYIKGFWLGRRTIRQNTQAGSLFADALARKLLDLKFLEQQSRPDIKYYMGQKRKMLSGKIKNLKPEQYTKLLNEVSPVDYGSELGVDQIITGEILSSYMSQHRTLGYWFSYVKVRVDVWDMATGKVVWSQEFSGKQGFSAQVDVMDEVAEKATKALNKKYYQKLNKPL